MAMIDHHALWVMIGAIIPILLVYLLPVLGVRNDLIIFLFILLIFIGQLYVLYALGVGQHENTGKDAEHGGHKKA